MEGHYVTYHLEDGQEVLRMYPSSFRRIYTIYFDDEDNIHLKYNHSDCLVKLTLDAPEINIGAIAMILRPHHVTHLKYMPANVTLKSRITLTNGDWQKNMVHAFFPNLMETNTYLMKQIHPGMNLLEFIASQSSQDDNQCSQMGGI